jgi:Rieske Fe-S protein
MTHGTIAGMLLSELIMNRPHRWESLYSPSRKSLKAALEFTRENVNVAGQYRDWLTPGEAGSVDEIRPGSGAVVRDGLSKHAVYRDEQGALHTVSAVCTHMGCIVDWNSTESTWDCPCHGSRFDPYGKVVNGPAIDDLARVQEPTATDAPVEVQD